MSAGARVRQLLGPVFPVAGNAYRRVFVDVRKVAAAIPDLGPDGVLLDVGGGDGAILNPLLDRQPTLRVVAVDLAPEIGSMIRADLRHRVALHPGISVRELANARHAVAPPSDNSHAEYSAALLSDVLHHVPARDRAELVADVLDALPEGRQLLVVKDIVPQGGRSALAFWADRNISGDRGVQAISPGECVELVRSVWPGATVTTTALADTDFPNYCLVFANAGAPPRSGGALSR